MFIVIEIQTDFNGVTTIGTPSAYSDRNDAEAKYHQVLMYAATSNTLKHAATMLTEEGVRLKNECYIHEQEPEPEE